MRINVLFILSIIILFTYISPLAPLIIDTISNSLTTSILIGNIYFSFLIDLNSNITLFTYDNLFDFSYSLKIVDKINMTYGENIVEHILFREQIGLKTFEDNLTFMKTIENYFYSLNSKGIAYLNQFSFSYTITDHRMNLVSQLYSYSLINKKSFGFDINKNSKGLMYFGSFPEEFIRNKTKGFCKMKDNQEYWGCDINKVIVNKEVYENKEEMLFITNETRIYAPQNFMNFLTDNIFKEYLRTKTCSYYSFYFDKHYCIVCDCSLINHQDDFIFDFEINSSKYRFKYNDLFTQINPKKCEFQIMKNNDDDNTWMFGLTFFYKFNPMFNYEDKTITFYGKDIISNDYSTLYNIGFIKTILVFVTLSSCLNIFLILYIIIFVNK